MKLIAPIVAAVAVSSTRAFSPAPRSVAFRTTTGFRATVEDTTGSDFASAVPKEPSIYDRIGFKEDDIAIGVDPEEVLKHLGTRDDLLAKFQRDNKEFDEERAAQEVDKFIMDAEMVGMFINYEKKKVEGEGMSRRAEAESKLSDPSTWATYAVWIIGGAGFAYVKNVIIEPKYRSGEWTETHIALPDFFHKATEVAADATTAM